MAPRQSGKGCFVRHRVENISASANCKENSKNKSPANQSSIITPNTKEEGIAFTELKENFERTVKTNNHFHQHLSLNTIGRSDYIYRVEGEI